MKTTLAIGFAFALLLLVPSCASDEDGATNGGKGGASGAGSGGAGASGSAGAGGGPSDGGNVDAGACGSLGAACDVSCPQGFDCMQGVCIPDSRPTCGGIVGQECPQGFPVCMTCIGCDFGPCFRDNEIACLCRGAGRSVFRCNNR